MKSSKQTIKIHFTYKFIEFPYDQYGIDFL